MIDFIKNLFTLHSKNDTAVDKKQMEAHKIKVGMTKDMLRIKEKIDRINLDTYDKLKKVSREIDSVTYRIAVSTGGKRRGLK